MIIINKRKIIKDSNLKKIANFSKFLRVKKKSRLGWRLGENRVVLNNSVYQGNFVKKHVACIHDY